MTLHIDTIIHLEDDEKFVLLSETVYEGAKYFLAMGVDEDNEIIREKVAILEETMEGEEIYVDRVTDPERVIALTGILKAQI